MGGAAREEGLRRLSELARAVGGTLEGADGEVTGVTVDTRRLRPGELFVAVPGTRLDGAAFIADALSRGAAAVCAQEGADTGAARERGTPVLRVRDARRALAALSAAFHGHPADSLRLVGITGTLGKSSTALLVQAALAGAAEDGTGVGVVGSLGAKVRGRAGTLPVPGIPDTNAMTTPDAPTLHHALRAMRDAGVRTVAMEVTSHALAQGRVEGLRLALGVFTNLVPDEHLEFHPTEEDYLRTKLRFVELLRPGAPLVINADDRLVRERVRAATVGRDHSLLGVSLGEAADAIYGEAPEPDDVVARVEELRWDGGGATFALRVLRPLPRLDESGAVSGETVEPCVVPIALPVLGLQQVANAALAATAALVAGASPAAIAAGIADLEAIPRRMEASLDTRPRVVDDTTGNPVSLRAVFASVDAIPHRALRVVFGLRGMRGPEINRRLAATLGEVVAARSRRGAVTLVVTGSEDAAGPRDRVRPEEREAAVAALDASGVPYTFEPELEDAVRRVLAVADPDDLVLLLGAQGMDHAARFARETLRTAGAVPPPA